MSDRKVEKKLEYRDDDNGGEIQPLDDTNRGEINDITADGLDTDIDDVVEDSRINIGEPLYDLYTEQNELGKDYSMNDTGGVCVNGYKSVEITPQGDVFGSHAELTDFLGKDGAQLSGRRSSGNPSVEAHHLIPDHVASRLGISEADGLCVALWDTSHVSDGAGVHSFLGQERGITFESVDDLKAHYAESYRELGFPEWGDRVGTFVDQNRETIEKHLR